MLSALQTVPPLQLAGIVLGLLVAYPILEYFISAIVYRRKARAHGCKLPLTYPHKDPIWGLDFTWKMIKSGKSKTALAESQSRFHTIGNTYYGVALGVKTIMTCEPEIVKNILALKFHDFSLPSLRKKCFHPIFGKGIFTTDGKEWEHSRGMLRPNFARAQVADLNNFESHIAQLINRIPQDGSTVDLQDLFFDLTLDSATEFLFGESSNTLAYKGEDDFASAFNCVTNKLIMNLQLGMAEGLPDRQYKKSLATVHNFTDRYVQKALRHYYASQMGTLAPEKVDNRYVFLHELVKQTQDPLTLRSEALNILLAGRDTTASLLADLWNMISKRPDVWAKLLAEVDQLNGEKPTFEKIKTMKYLRYCLNEALRLFPVVPLNSRSAVRDTVLPIGGGPDGKSQLFVPKGTVVSYNVYAMQRRTDLYGPDAAEFRPERWEKLRPGWEYLPFNGGPRICLGQQYALAEASYTTIRLMQHFRTIESRDPEPWTEWLTITCASANGAKVVLRR
ncbi:hypothetical protein AJ80_03271 [Polytolypa hystricis UAMH7299]|uniref:Cytochrome P450 alkane hydroxylase n=1 Tax=Polytolypa hystricis (strain UAMH7299) TaxID=1447883 RepID=A0A2B7YBB7_POLH7|nr:hypothetical protein AJ80_03271 [Polytolypa hystricis UAMH7299]